ncbi:MAG TPA: hypothetical protein VG184_09745 [Acidimicrobiales bacterium]|nr:hypothetical protein [Acidimicrobiales bacterium]
MTVLDPPQTDEEADVPGPPDAAPGGGHHLRWERLVHWVARPQSLVTLLVVAACTVYTFNKLQPSNIFANTTPTGGDMGAHVWLPWFVEHKLLPHFRITGWAMDWYAGFPALTYYFPLPILMIVAVNVILPYNIAFKLVAVLGLIALPAAAWAFGRLARMPFPGPACLAAATLPYLFSRDFTIYGGNIASTMAGEFAFSISLVFALLFLGVVARGLDTGRHRFIAALLLLGAGLSHLLPTIFAVAGALVLTAMYRDRRRWRWTIPVLVVAALLSAWWSLAFELRLPYATNMGYQKIVAYVTTLFPANLTWLFVIAAVGAAVSVARRHRIGTFLTIMAVLSLVAFRVAPQSRLWNARVLPFWYLCLYLLVGVAFVEVGTLIVEAIKQPRRVAWPGPQVTGITSKGLVAVPVVTLLAALIWVGYPLRSLPFGHTSSTTGKFDWLGITSNDNSFVPGWVSWNLSGYQAPDKSRRGEYFALVAAMGQIGKTVGCGRAMWEYEPELNDMGTPDALMLLPYWTNGCIGSMEGLYYESSGTTPYHFLDAAELSDQPSNPVRGLPYPAAPNVAEGVEHLQMFGVKYYMSISPQTQQQANADPSLKLVKRVGPFTINYTSGNTTSPAQRYWNIYQVLDSTLVTPLTNRPVVMKGVSGGNTAWLNPSVAWYDDPSRWSVYEAASGPSTWDRVSPSDTSPPQTPLPPVHVTGVKVGEESMSFNVDRTGVPVLVNTSYFPNWQTSGARGPYRVTPNLMVVIPTSKHVSLHYGATALNWTGYVLTAAGVVGLVALWRLGVVAFPGRRRRRSDGSEEQEAAEAEAPGGPSEPYVRLGHELAGAPRGSDWHAEDLDNWLGHPGGLESGG